MPLGSVADDEHRKTWFRVGFDAARANPKAGAPGAVNITADQLTALAIIVDKAVSHGLPEAAEAKKIITELKTRLSRKMTAARARDAKRVV